MSIEFSIINIIQAMLAPGVMINACGLLLLGMNNKYSLVVNRIRLLNEEKRKYFSKAGEKDFQFDEEIRLKSITTQLEKLQYRVRLVRNAVVSYSIAIGIFVITSFIIGYVFFNKTKMYDNIILFTFSIGMLLVFIGIYFAAKESIKGYDIIEYEIKSHE